jgi:hypothetical protein
MKSRTKEQRKAEAEAAQELLSNPAFVVAMGKLSERAVQQILVTPPNEAVQAVYRLQAIKAIQDDLQAVADDLKLLHGTT